MRVLLFLFNILLLILAVVALVAYDERLISLLFGLSSSLVAMIGARLPVNRLEGKDPLAYEESPPAL